MTRRARFLLVAGTALVLLLNAIVLGGVAWNRSGTPDAVLRLSERELTVPYMWREAGEDSGLRLSLSWQEQGGYLLDAEGLEALGFRLPPLPSGPVEIDEIEWPPTPPARKFWLALEFDGPAHQHRVRRLEEELAEAERMLAENPQNDLLQELLKSEPSRLTNMLRDARETSTRLIIVDADRDRGALRARYPDRERYAIVRGLIEPTIDDEFIEPDADLEGELELRVITQSRAIWRGWVLNLDVDHIHVPLAFREAFAAPASRDEPASRYEVTLAFGRRGEPWILAARPAER
jgi:hypothetical protein